MLVFVVVVYALTVIAEYKKLIKGKNKKEIILYGVTLTVSFILAILSVVLPLVPSIYGF
jgi:hypothetical protein